MPCYRPINGYESTLWFMARIGGQYLQDPWSGNRRMVEYLPEKDSLTALPRNEPHVSHGVKGDLLKAAYAIHG